MQDHLHIRQSRIVPGPLKKYNEAASPTRAFLSRLDKQICFPIQPGAIVEDVSIDWRH